MKSINTGRLQGNNVKIQTENGEIKVQSSYCENILFESQTGKISLQNAHKNVKIMIHQEGNLNISKFYNTFASTSF